MGHQIVEFGYLNIQKQTQKDSNPNLEPKLAKLGNRSRFLQPKSGNHVGSGLEGFPQTNKLITRL